MEGYTTPGGYSSKRGEANRVADGAWRLRTMIAQGVPRADALGHGWHRERRADAGAVYPAWRSDTVQVCTGVMKFGYECVKPMCDATAGDFMAKHKFETLA